MKDYLPRWFLGLILVVICVLGVVRGNGDENRNNPFTQYNQAEVNK